MTAMPERKLLYLSLVLCPMLYFSPSIRAEFPFPRTDSITPVTQPAESAGTYIRTEDGLIVYPDPDLSGNAGAVQLQVVTDNIIRVIASPTPGAFSSPVSGIDPQKSLITVYRTDLSAKWDIKNNKNTVVLPTRLLKATITIATGAVSFTDPAGTPILSETVSGVRSFESTVFDGEPSYHIRQTLATRPDEALYGLGQHQDGLVNYKGRQTNLFQNNTEVAIPFLLSNNNYGVLWDNYSLTTVGDIRPYQPLSALKLFSKDGKPGWLTASYSNDSRDAARISFEKAESAIDYSYLHNARKKCPPELKIASGVVVGQGSLAFDLPGKHIFRCSYGEYKKIGIDEKFLLDRGRKAGNPGPALLPLPMEK